MNIKLYIPIVLCALSLGWAGCSEYEMDRYQNSPAIYFHRSTNAATRQLDSVNHTFFFNIGDSFLEDTVWVRVNAMGLTEAFDRPIALVQTNKDSTNAAKAGVHYKAFDSPGIREKMVIPAGAAYARVPIVLMNDESLALHEVRLELTVAGNEHFRPGIDKQREFVVTTTAQAVKPLIWDQHWAPRFGASWGSEKYRFMIQATGYTEWDVLSSDVAFINWLMNTVKEALRVYNLENPENPLKEANGDLVVFETF